MIKVAREFSNYLVNRNSAQGDGTFTGVDFRRKYMTELERDEWWRDSSKSIDIDFDGVRTLGPSWANEVFAYFTQNRSKELILSKIRVHNLSPTKREIIDSEIESGHLTGLSEAK